MRMIFIARASGDFRQIATLVDRNEPIDVITVSDRLLATGELDSAGGHTYLADLVEQTPTAANVSACARAVERAVAEADRCGTGHCYRRFQPGGAQR